MIKKILIYTTFLIIFIIIISLYSFLISIFPRKYVTPIQPSDLNLEYKNITLTTSDNIKLDAWFIPNKKKDAIIVGHGYPFDKGNILPIAEFLHKNYSLLFFDFRAMGKSQGSYTTVGYKEVEDVKAAIKYLKDNKIKNIGALGFSLSAATIIMTQSKDIKAIVSDSSYANLDLMIDSMYRQFFFLKYPFTYLTKLFAKIFLKIDTKEISPEKAITQLKTPILLIHGEKDFQISVENSYRLKKANPDAELWIVKGAGHGQAHALKKQEYETKVIDFFNKHLK